MSGITSENFFKFLQYPWIALVLAFSTSKLSAENTFLLPATITSNSISIPVENPKAPEIIDDCLNPTKKVPASLEKPRTSIKERPAIKKRKQNPKASSPIVKIKEAPKAEMSIPSPILLASSPELALNSTRTRDEILSSLKNSDKVFLEIDPLLRGSLQLSFDKHMSDYLSLVGSAEVESEKILLNKKHRKNFTELNPEIFGYGLGMGVKVKLTRMVHEDIFILPHAYFGLIEHSIPDSEQQKRSGWRRRLGFDIGWERSFITRFVFTFRGGIARSFDDITPFTKPELEYTLNVGGGYVWP